MKHGAAIPPAEMRPQDHQNLADAAQVLERALSESTGLDPLSRKKVTYFSLATHALPSLDDFPACNLVGKYSCGKSTTMKIMACFSRKPNDPPISLNTSTVTAIRDAFAAGYEATVFCEEANEALHDRDGKFESLISNRFSRSTSQAQLKEKSPRDRWNRKNTIKDIFGATVMHRRVLSWSDPALDSRTIEIRFQSVNGRIYQEFPVISQTPWFQLGMQKVVGLTLVLDPSCGLPASTSGRVAAVYRPLLGVAQHLGDSQFSADLLREAEEAAEAIREGQQDEPDVLILQTLFACMFSETYGEDPKSYHPINLIDIRQKLFNDYHLSFAPRQIAKEFREMGLEVKRSHGCTKVFVQPSTVLEAAERIGYEDMALDRIRKLVKSKVVDISTDQSKTNWFDGLK